jgi:hypothetical protein
VTVAVASQGEEPEPPPPEQKPGSDWTRHLTWWDQSRIQREDTDRAGWARLRVGTPPYVVTVTPPVEMGLLAPPPAPLSGDSVTIRLEAGLSVSGVLEDTEGDPVAGAFVWWRTPAGTWTSKRAEANGTFSIGALPEGAVELWGDALGRQPPPELRPLVTAAGREGVRVIVDVGGKLRVRIENWPTGAEGDAVLRDRTETFGRLSVLPARVSDAGEAVFRRLVPGHAYALRVATDDETLVAFRDDAAGEGDTVRVRVTPVTSLRLAVEGDAPFVVTNVTVADFLVPWSPVGDASAHEFRVDDLPRGRVVLEVAGRTPDGARLTGSVEADAPGAARVRLAPAREAK